MVGIADKQWAKILAHAWTNPEFKVKLERDPTAALQGMVQEFGFESDVLFPVPAPPEDLTDEQLDQLVSGQPGINSVMPMLFHAGPEPALSDEGPKPLSDGDPKPHLSDEGPKPLSDGDPKPPDGS